MSPSSGLLGGLAAGLPQEPFQFGGAELLFVVVSAAIILGQGLLRGWGGKLFASRPKPDQEARDNPPEPVSEPSPAAAANPRSEESPPET